MTFKKQMNFMKNWKLFIYKKSIFQNLLNLIKKIVFEFILTAHKELIYFYSSIKSSNFCLFKQYFLNILLFLNSKILLFIVIQISNYMIVERRSLLILSKILELLNNTYYKLTSY